MYVALEHIASVSLGITIHTNLLQILFVKPSGDKNFFGFYFWSILVFIGFDSSHDREQGLGLKRGAIVMISEGVQYLDVKWALWWYIWKKNIFFSAPLFNCSHHCILTSHISFIFLLLPFCWIRVCIMFMMLLPATVFMICFFTFSWERRTLKMVMWI